VTDRAHLTINAIQQAVIALPAPTYLIRVIDSISCRCTFDDEWRLPALLRPNHAKFLRAMNANGAHIYFRPNNRRHVMLDDIDTATLDNLAKDGLMPALVTETSPTNLQVWITVSKQDLTPSDESSIARELARRYGGDPGAAHGAQFGRLPGFRNRKLQHRSPEGGYPLVKIARRIRSFVASGAGTLLQSFANEPNEHLRAVLPPSPQGGLCSLTLMSPDEAKMVYDQTAAEVIERFGSAEYANDRSRFDYAIARNLHIKGFNKTILQTVIREGSEKAAERGESYVRATAAAGAAGT
jgi:hypothetical protein